MTLDELKLLLALNDNQRIIYAEVEIFASKELYTCYLELLNKGYFWFNNHKIHYEWLACFYAHYVIKGRWPEAEALMKTNPFVLKCYD
jgi:hypothetical protein